MTPGIPSSSAIAIQDDSVCECVADEGKTPQHHVGTGDCTDDRHQATCEQGIPQEFIAAERFPEWIQERE